jgi:hypothetical protein
MSETPDLGKIVSLIMENPDLISRIQELAKGEDTKATPPPAKEVIETTAPIEISSTATIDSKEKRNRLLGAMKPYLSSDRAKAIDSVMSVVEILDMMKPR